VSASGSHSRSVVRSSRRVAKEPPRKPDGYALQIDVPSYLTLTVTPSDFEKMPIKELERLEAGCSPGSIRRGQIAPIIEAKRRRQDVHRGSSRSAQP
jgi:hypothetical protein